VRVDRIRLVDFRNYREKEIEPAGISILVGPNASGKTNLIEALRLATATVSFRNPHLSDVVRRGRDTARVEVEAAGDSSHAAIRLDISSDGKRTYTVNGTRKRRLADVAGIVPSVVFTPDDLDVVKASGETRRGTLDTLGATLWATYGKLARDYGKAVRHRNRLLKEDVSDEETRPWTSQVTELGARLLTLRIRLLRRLERPMIDAYGVISGGEGLSVDYEDAAGLPRDAWRDGIDSQRARASMEEHLRARARDEERRRTTLVGPHRDDVVFRIDGSDARAFASQGQQRSIALAWKIAEFQVVRDVARRRPVLLLDDVMSELDEERRTAFAGFVGEATQTFITTTNLGYFDEATLEAATVFPLEP
jgi:DNA replication and repair protein RecF